MNGGSSESDTSVERIAVSVSTLEGGKQRGMNVNQSARPPLHERRVQNAHEARQTDQLDWVLDENTIDRLLEFVSIREFLVLNQLYAKILRISQFLKTHQS